MRLTSFAAFLLTAVVARSALGADEPEQSLSIYTRADIEEIVKGYIQEHPEIIKGALEAAQRHEAGAAQERAQKALVTDSDVTFHDPMSPKLGNPKGDLTIVEFSDYQCPYCKGMFDGLSKVVADDGNIRLVIKEMPILGEPSTFAARAALIANRLGKYQGFHDALMAFHGQLSDDIVIRTAADMHIDLTALKVQDKSPQITAIDAALTRNRLLANDLAIDATPSFVIGNTIYRGTLPDAALKQAIADARKHGS